MIKNEYNDYLNTLTEEKYYSLLNNENIFNLNSNDFIDWLNKEQIEYNNDEIIRDWDYIKLDIYAEIGNAKWGKNINYKIKSLYDKQILESIKQLK